MSYLNLGGSNSRYYSFFIYCLFIEIQQYLVSKHVELRTEG